MNNNLDWEKLQEDNLFIFHTAIDGFSIDAWWSCDIWYAALHKNVLSPVRIIVTKKGNKTDVSQRNKAAIAVTHAAKYFLSEGVSL